jgi:hypothetical protein
MRVFEPIKEILTSRDGLKVINIAEIFQQNGRKRFEMRTLDSFSDREDNNTLNDQDDNGEIKIILGTKPQRFDPTIFIKKIRKRKHEP